MDIQVIRPKMGPNILVINISDGDAKGQYRAVLKTDNPAASLTGDIASERMRQIMAGNGVIITDGTGQRWERGSFTSGGGKGKSGRDTSYYLDGGFTAVETFNHELTHQGRVYQFYTNK